MSRIETTRRNFLRGVSLGAGASLLAPLSDRLIKRALGAEGDPVKRLIVMSVYMMEPANYVPDEIRAAASDARGPVSPSGVNAWPSLFAPLSAYTNRMCFVDGCRNLIRTHQHRAGTSALSCLDPTTGSPERMGPAGGATIDQHIARVLGRDAPHESVLWGVTGDGIRDGRSVGTGIFAAGPEQNLNHFENAGSMLDLLFPDPAGPGTTPTRSPFRPIRDRLVTDLGRLKQRLAPEERRGLERYEMAIESFDRRQAALAQLSCEAPPSAPTMNDPQDHLESMMLQSTLALQCGLTNVVGITVGTSGNHNMHMPVYRSVTERSSDPRTAERGQATYYGHGASGANQVFALEARRNFHELHLSQLAQLMDTLSNTPAGDGHSVMDHTAVLYVTGNGKTAGGHHANTPNNGEYWPAFIVAGAQTGLRTEGRYLRFGTHHRFSESYRNLSALYATLSLGLGVDPGRFEDPTSPAGRRIDALLRT